MGYTTTFEGQFNLNKPLESLKILDTLSLWQERDKSAPIDGYCQWIFTKDRKGIKWDGIEKFYQYQEWLQHIIDDLLLPNGYSLSGQVEFQGEDVSDHGFLYIENNMALIRKQLVKTMICPHCGKTIQLKENNGDE